MAARSVRWWCWWSWCPKIQWWCCWWRWQCGRSREVVDLKSRLWCEWQRYTGTFL